MKMQLRVHTYNSDSQPLTYHKRRQQYNQLTYSGGNLTVVEDATGQPHHDDVYVDGKASDHH